jgi:excisionase family DNA binding protein
MDKLILNLKEASQYLNISQSKLSGMALKKEIRSYKIGKCRRFHINDLYEFLEKHAEGGDEKGKSGGSSRKEAYNE